MTEHFPYTRLPGTRRGILLSASLWEGSDHFLLVRNTRFSETYKRFFYRDVQAILVRRSSRFSLPFYWFLAIVLVAVAAIAEEGLHLRLPFRSVSLVALAGLVLWWILVSVFRSCTCHVKTAASKEELTALFRIGPTTQALAILSARIQQAQESLGAVTLDTPTPSEQAPQIIETVAKPPVVPVTRIAIRLSLASFLILLVDAAFTFFFASHQQEPPIQVAGAILIFVEAAMLVAALVALWPFSSARVLRNLLIASLVFAGLTYYAGGMGTRIMAAFKETGQNGVPSFFGSYQAALNVVNELGNLGLGTAGLAALFRRSYS